MRYLITKQNEKPFFAVELTEELLTDSIVYDLLSDTYTTNTGWEKIKFDNNYNLGLDMTLKLKKSINPAIIRDIIVATTDAKLPEKDLLLLHKVYNPNDSEKSLSYIKKAIDTGSYISIECNEKGIFLSLKTSIQVFNEHISRFLRDLYKLIFSVNDELIVRAYNENCIKLLRKGQYNRHY